MKAIATALQEVYGLFVEDAGYAIAIVVMLAIAVLIFRPFAGGVWRGPALFLGMAAILIESVVRAARVGGKGK